MKFRLIALAVILCMSAVSCSSNEGNSYSSPETSKESISVNIEDSQDEVMAIKDSEEAFKEKYKDVESAEKGPLISVGNSTAKAGEIAEVTVSVKGAERNWNMCGIHLTYPEELECVYQFEDDRNLEYEKGEASEKSTGIVAMEWKKENLPPEELTKQHLGSMFFTVMFNGNEGLDGDIITLYLKIPEDAESGTVYPVGFYFKDTDMFRNMAKDLSLEKYAFENMQAGSITVE